MTTVTFHMEGDRITGFDVRGHSGYAEALSLIHICQGQEQGKHREQGFSVLHVKFLLGMIA